TKPLGEPSGSTQWPPIVLPRIGSPRARLNLEIDLGNLSDPLEDALPPTPVTPMAALPEDLLDAPPSVLGTSAPPSAVTGVTAPAVPPPSVSVPPTLFYPPTSASRLLSSPLPATASHEEASLFRDLSAGSYEAGDRLIQLFVECGED